MTIAVSRNSPRKSSRYALTGELSRYANWVQTLELPADDNTVSISGQVVEITFRADYSQTAADLTVSSAASQITITDADTLSISVTSSVISALTEDQYYTDLTSTLAGVITHWAHGIVAVRNSPAD